MHLTGTSFLWLKLIRPAFILDYKLTTYPPYPSYMLYSLRISSRLWPDCWRLPYWNPLTPSSTSTRHPMAKLSLSLTQQALHREQTSWSLRFSLKYRVILEARVVHQQSAEWSVDAGGLNEGRTGDTGRNQPAGRCNQLLRLRTERSSLLSVTGVDNGESSRDFAGNCGSICRSDEIDVDENYVHAFLTDDSKD